MAGENAQQPHGQVVDVVQALAQVGVWLAQEAVAHVGMDTLCRRLGGEAGIDGLADAAHPAAVIGEHAEGLQHFARSIAAPDIHLGDQIIHLDAQPFDGLFEVVALVGY